ncbi:MAG: 50S ribosomal protein L23 [Patescibacteria group bacterium]|nr:50S ribosomal protein L23 [Patescibacteria group bacterium]MDD5715373.1 50S ribosomal protein L23 [Patescibacteria group bacterium]
MGLFDRLKKKAKDTAPKEAAAPRRARPAVPKEAKKSPEKVKEQAVVTPDGKLVAVQKKEEAPKKKDKQAKEETGEAYRVLIRPLITEKGSSLTANNQYVFEVAPRANKIEIHKAFRKVYGIKPLRVGTVNMRGKSIRYGKTQGETKRWRKAIVTLPQGQKIDIQEGL